MIPNSVSFKKILENLLHWSHQNHQRPDRILPNFHMCVCVTSPLSTLYQNDGLMMMLWCLGNICGVYSPESSEHSLLQFSFVIPNKSSNHRSNLVHHHQPGSQPTLLQICKILTKFDKTEPNWPAEQKLTSGKWSQFCIFCPFFLRSRWIRFRICPMMSFILLGGSRTCCANHWIILLSFTLTLRPQTL